MSVAILFGRMFSKIVFTADFSMASLPGVLWDGSRELHVCNDHLGGTGISLKMLKIVMLVGLSAIFSSLLFRLS